jgi:hypothetical protein
MFQRMWLAYQTVGRTFGAWLSSLFTGWMLLNLWVSNSVGMLLDPIFFPSLRKKELRSPIVIVGNPRTGTTFLHRFMADKRLGAGMQLWRMIFPSLTLQLLLRPFTPLMEKVSPARFHAAAAHKTSLTAIETDDPSTLFRFFDGFFLYGFILAWAEQDFLPMFEPEKRDTSRRDFDWFEAMWRRNLVARDHDRVLAKVFSLGLRLPAFLERFPDARILYMVRDPLEVVPSGMSLVTGVIEGRWGFWKRPEALRRRYIERLYAAFLELSRRFCEDWESGRVPRDKVYIVRYDRMMSDFEGVMGEILEFTGISPERKLLDEIHATGERQRGYKSEHKYDLARFGLDEARIRRDYAFFYRCFGLD